VWVSLNSRKVCGEDGQILYSEGFIEDITERRRDEEFIKTSENKFRMAFMTGADAFSIATLNEGLILDVNDRFAEVFGYPADEARGKTSTQLGLYANHDRGRLISELTAKGYVSNLEFEALRKNGERRSVVVSASVMESTGEQLILVVVKDITEEKRAEAGLKTLTTAVEQANETIVITDLNGTIQYCNPAFSKVTGYSKDPANTTRSSTDKCGRPLRKGRCGADISPIREKMVRFTKKVGQYLQFVMLRAKYPGS
jgi:PAS domain S-box-containing protein